MSELKKIPGRLILLLVLPLIFPVLPVFLKGNLEDSLNKIIYSHLEPQFKLIIEYPEVEPDYKQVKSINISLIEKSLDIVPYKEETISEKKIKEPPPDYKIRFIYIGINKKFVMINGKLYRENDRISKDERIKKIEKDRILLTGKWGERWILFSK